MGSRRVLRVAVNTKAWTPTESEWLTSAQTVQREEKERIGKFVFKGDAKLSMVGRLLIRTVLADLTGRGSADIRLGRTEKGKPYAVAMPDFRGSFNVSHQGDYAIIAADSHDSVGTDVMKIEHRKDVNKFFSTMRRQLTSQEWAVVNRQHKETDRLAMFYRFWCLKESYVKAIGTGIGFEMKRLNFHIETERLSTDSAVSDTMVEVDGCQQKDWVFEETMLDHNHCAAIATQLSLNNRKTSDQTKTSLFETWTAQELLAKCEPLQGIAPDHEYWTVFNAKSESPNSRPS